MSSFSYGKHTKKHIGIWLRHRNIPDIITKIKETGNKRLFDSIDRVVISEYDEVYDEVWIEVWCINVIDMIRKKHRYNVFYIKTTPHENWSCDGDLGSGINF